MQQGRASAAPLGAPASPQADTPWQTVVPASDLGASFERPALVQLGLSTKARVWGDASRDALEPPPSKGWGPTERSALLSRLHHRCMFCGLESQTAEVHNRNDNHGDLRPENLGAADPICHRWQHLGELVKGNAMLVYLPGLSPCDASHLVRTTLVALQSSDPDKHSAARKVLNWMASHHVYVDDAWGSSDPAAFASALARTVAEDRDRKNLALRGLALVIHPDSLRQHTTQWTRELAARHGESTWSDLHHRVTNAPI